MHSPPRLLTGITLLFWGAMTGHTVAGLIAALLAESRSWLTTRWHFSRESYTRTWHFCVLGGALITLLAWLNGVKIGKLHTLFIWAPLVALPLELAQRYGRADKIPLNTFSFFARKKMEHDIREGRDVRPRLINTGYPYIALVLLATAMASKNDIHHFLGLGLILAACLYFNSRHSGFRPMAWVTAIMLAFSLAYAGQWAMFKAYHLYTGAQGDASGGRTHANESRTSIGKLGRIKLSPKIFWRMKVNEGNVPKLLRTATYNRYSHTRWIHDYDPPGEDSQRDDEDYMDSTLAGSQDRRIDIFRDENTPENAPLPSFPDVSNISLLGELDDNILNNPIPLPHHTTAIGDLKQEVIACNSLGTVLMGNSDYNVVQYSVWTGDHSTTEIPYNNNYDLAIPATELESLRRISKQLGLHKLTTRQKILRIRNWFNTEFTYSTHLTTPRMSRDQRQSAIGIFLERTRSGHCEYFATATALLLRESGVPTRYAVGFSVNERDHDRAEWVMRGQHAHAWTRVWVDGQWEDIDLTPPAWLALDGPKTTGWQRKLADWWQRVREDFLIWRTNESNKTAVMTVIICLVSLLVMWISWRLWRSRQKGTQRTNKKHRQLPAQLTALHKLEPHIGKLLGNRPEGTPMSPWLQRVHQYQDQELTEKLTLAGSLHDQIRFDPLQEKNNLSDELTILCKEIKTLLKRAKKHTT